MSNDTIKPRLVNTRDFMAYTGLGCNRARDFGREIGARVEIGGRVLFDLKKTDEYLDGLCADYITPKEDSK